MKKLTYFPGCSAHGTSEEFDHTLKLVMKPWMWSWKRFPTGIAAAPPPPM